ncbi:proline racemase family protein [Pseudarthrobacter sp. NS4]|uniref:proline racemase family protein n=1 Tax=Pseudarthrobacter sp. NS4 TaxID=2973976 RepID=UPI00216392BA|nr:proline racemase family protein [Pseudarthrobacter sp. NS4]
MRFGRMLNVVDAHAEGESGKVVVGGVGPVPGETMFDKMLHFSEHLDHLRKLLLCEPRGAVWHNANVVLPSNNPDADFGYIILESTEYPAMSGSNTMCVATVLLETGMLPMTEPVTHLVLESPAGLIGIEATCASGKVERVKLVNQPAFVYHQDAKIDVPGVGKVSVDVAYGGMTFAFVDAGSVGIPLEAGQEAVLYDLGQRIKKAAAEQLEVRHPTNPRIPGITNTSFTGPLIREDAPDGAEMVRSKNAVIVSPGRLDRSPCGMGTSARLALLHARGELKPGQLFRPESLIGSQFDARIEDTTRLGPYAAVIPAISGRAWITSLNQLVLDPSDPFQEGFVVGKPWKSEY